MLLNLKVDNYKGVSAQINISCVASNKIKHVKNEISKISDKTNALKNICLIGSNASGKTSILDSVKTVQDFLFFPYRKQISSDKKYLDQINKMSADELKKFLIDFNTLKLGEQNNLRSKDKSTISLEIYVPKRKNNVSGVYTYTIMYKSNYLDTGVLMEKLEYRKDYDSKKNTSICLANNIIESEVSTAVIYRNNSTKKNNDNDLITYYKSFIDEMMKNVLYITEEAYADIIDSFRKNGDKFISLCNIADDKIVDVTLDENKNNSQILFWNSKNTYLKFSQLSNGTKKMLIIGSIILNSLNNNNLIIIDELELSLHPSLAWFLIKLSASSDLNHYNQLIFTTHSPFIAFSVANDQLYYINNKNSVYEVLNINKAIKNGVITKDKNPQKAWLEDLLIKNPDEVKIRNFFS